VTPGHGVIQASAPASALPQTQPPPGPLLLAPMEGLLDACLRDALTRLGGARRSGVDRCVSEFIRITDQLLPPRVFTRLMPELLNGSCTPSGTPVRAQLLGSDPSCVADNAARLAELGAEGIDLNFGCPAKTVNRHRGGAVLLDEPELVHAIVAAVRRSVPAEVPVSAKMRLGNLDASRALDNAQGIEAAGASELVVHARTKVHGYQPPAYWAQIAPIRERLQITVVANGEIWTVADAARCRAESGCSDLMLGRGMVADPGLALQIGGAAPTPWAELAPLMAVHWRRTQAVVSARHQAGRMKQWLHHLRRRYPEAEGAHQALRTIQDPARFAQALWATVGVDALARSGSAPVQTDHEHPRVGGDPAGSETAAPQCADA
jgi:tRNA-dihydrouridine synthase C